ncbi:MAG: aminotransferase class I/II-fold pyridoxal phosphate-dependent enzyme, partial [Nitrospirae bacterium]|nr:aminotransferase class I/II-fold pyridoxal phosphate-dependent enzyme [Nitrospirota bacterium]
MKIPLVDLKAGYRPLKREILTAIETVLDGMNLHLGPNVQSLEEEFAAYCDVKYAVGVGSGTDAIFIALIAAGIKPGDEVITTPHTFFATVEAIVHAGAVPVFVDIDPITFNINPSLIKEKITKKTKAIIPVHMYGQTAEMKEIADIADRHGLKIIEDSCQAHGAEYLGKRAGSLGAAGCF